MRSHVRVESIDLESGEFAMTLATEGEASDGDILSIRGGETPPRVPLLNSHFNHPNEVLGTVDRFKKHLDEQPKRLRARGTIELDGEGPVADVRRDLAFMISKGHVDSVSIRWEPIEFVRRINLPSNHEFFVDAETETSMMKRWGRFYKKWRALEGSVVALPADKLALIGRAEETEGAVRTFWQGLAGDCDRHVEASLDMLARVALDLRESGQYSAAELINAVTLEDAEEGDFEVVAIGETNVVLPRALAEILAAERDERDLPDDEPIPDLGSDGDADLRQEDEPDTPAPQPQPQPPRMGVQQIAEVISRAIGANNETLMGEFERRLDRARGRVS